MSSEQIPVPCAPRHVEKDWVSDWMAVCIGETVVLVHEPGDESTTTYTIDRVTRNPRVMAAADAVLWEGDIALTYYEDRSLAIQHQFAGRLDWLPIDELLDAPVPVLERTELVQLQGVGGRMETECIDCGKQIDREPNQIDIPGIPPQRCVPCTFDRMVGEPRR